jgi:hypothetical protein
VRLLQKVRVVQRQASNLIILTIGDAAKHL